MSFPLHRTTRVPLNVPGVSNRPNRLLVHGFPISMHRAVYRQENPYGHAPDGLTDEFLLRCGYVPVTPTQLASLAEWFWKGGQFEVSGSITHAYDAGTGGEAYDFTSNSPTLDPLTMRGLLFSHFEGQDYGYPAQRAADPLGWGCRNDRPLFPDIVYDPPGDPYGDIVSIGDPDANSHICSLRPPVSVLWNRDDDQPWDEVPLYVAIDFSLSWYHLRSPDGLDNVSIQHGINNSYSMQYPAPEAGDDGCLGFTAWVDMRGLLFPLAVSYDFGGGLSVNVTGTLTIEKSDDIAFFAP